MPETIFEFRCRNHVVRMNLEKSGAYVITVTHTGITSVATGVRLGDSTYEVAEVIDRDLAVHCFNHTVQQYQNEAA